MRPLDKADMVRTNHNDYDTKWGKISEEDEGFDSDFRADFDLGDSGISLSFSMCYAADEV